ncbi:sulfur carrier protein ThiS [Arenimonas sp.]|uniref:sulfur carrier protein ThiS n=1 Tax=Arenimonas sp. TaxID=1872635 RepID=UPI0035B363E3
MHIMLNGQPTELAGTPTVAGLLEQTGLAGRKVAVEVNQEVVPRSRHEQHALAEGDRVEIIHAIGGG